MNVSVKHVNLTNDSNNITKAIATICIDESFNVEGVTVKRSKEDNLYVQLPQRSYYDKETREEISKIVLAAYNEKLKEHEENVQKKTKNSLKNAKSKDEEPEEEETL